MLATGLVALAGVWWWQHRGPASAGRVLFIGGRAAGPLPDGGSAWPDREGGRVVLFDRDGVVRGVLSGGGGGPTNARPLVHPLFAFAVNDEVWVSEGDGAILRFAGDTAVGWLETVVRAAPGAALRGRLVAARGIDEFALAPVAAGAPLVWLLDSSGRATGILDSVTRPPNPLLTHLANAGWVAADVNGVYFVSALSPEVRRYALDGTLEWIATRPLTAPPRVPELRVIRGAPRVTVALVQHAATVGPDGRLYVLGADHPGADADRVYVFDREGRLWRKGEVPAGSAVYGDTRGRVTVLPREVALARTGEQPRLPFPPFALPALDGRDTVRLADYGGKTVVLTFWASWCGPCRQEMPALERLWQELDTAGVMVIGLNEDANSNDARRFAAEVGVTYPLAEGRGRLRARYGYRGLPYTIVLDREHRVARTFYGFGESFAPLRDAVLAELGRSGASGRAAR